MSASRYVALLEAEARLADLETQLAVRDRCWAALRTLLGAPEDQLLGEAIEDLKARCDAAAARAEKAERAAARLTRSPGEDGTS